MRRLAVIVVLLGLAVGLLARGDVPCTLFSVQPACYVALHPGPTEDTLGLVEIDGEATYASTGSLLLTTVRVDATLSLGEWVGASFTREISNVPREAVYPRGTTTAEVRRQNLLRMDESQVIAAAAGLRWLGYEVDLTPQGAEVAVVTEGGSADGLLRRGDVVVAVDGAAIPDAAAASEVVSGADPGSAIVLTVVRGAERVEVDVEVEHSSDEVHAEIGVLFRDHVNLPIDIGIDAGDIGGPSAGMMFALAVIDLLTTEDLTGGAVIAGTGSVGVDGEIGGMGGIRQKIAAATSRAERPANVFLVPSINAGEARRAPAARPLLVVPVETLDDAVVALRAIKAGREPEGAFALGRGEP